MSNKQAEKYKDQGNDEFKKGDFAKAIECYTLATEMDPKNPVYFTNRSMCYFKMADYAKSLRDAEKSIKLNPNWVKGYYRAGMACLEDKNFKSALDFLDKAAGLEPSTPAYAQAAEDAKKRYYATLSPAEIIKMEGNAFFKVGEIDKAAAKFSEALMKVTGNDDASKLIRADLYANRAMCNQQRWKYSEVTEDCTSALECNPNHVKALVRRAQAYEALEKYKASLADFDKASSLAPDMEVAFKGAVRLRSTLRRLGEL